MRAPNELRLPLAREAQRLGVEVVGPAAADVDRQARFPHEAIAAFRQSRLLGALVPEALGGLGAELSEVAAVCTALGQHCASAAMVMAMHQIQVACLVRHSGTSAVLREYLSELAKKQLLIASVTSEMGVGGDMRSSKCGVETTARGFELKKDATTISYGEHADDLLVTARRAPDAAANDQVLVLVRKHERELERKGGWDTLGMRGTCSPPFMLTARGHAEQVMPVPFAEIASETMVPVSHILWASVWLGIATDAYHRARAFVRDQARRTPGTIPPTATRLSELWGGLQVMRNNVHDALGYYQQLLAQPDAREQTSTMGFALKMNNLKVSTSQQVADLAQRALSLTGIAGYKNDSKFALGRHLRDSLSAALMVGNDRIHATNAALLLVYKDE
jgi:acyl-CoA dehydrogenase